MDRASNIFGAKDSKTSRTVSSIADASLMLEDRVSASLCNNYLLVFWTCKTLCLDWQLHAVVSLAVSFTYC